MLYGLTVLLSAFLLFQVQLVIAKHLLPWFGGTPAVWTTCQVFFQIVLLAGYAYAHGISRIANRRRQAMIHVGVLLGACVPLVLLAVAGGTPLLPGEAFQPRAYREPMPQLLLALAASAALPFFALSATSPLLQRWHTWSGRPLDRTYRLYGLSNAGSFLGLVSYPFAVEPLFNLTTQAWVWTAVFAAFVVSCGAVAWRLFRAPDVAPSTAETSVEPAPAAIAVEPAVATAPEPPHGAPALPRRVSVLWILLPAISSAMFLSTTNQLVQDVASVPFLWMLPLALYLLTFVVCFDRPRWYARKLFLGLAGLGTIGVLALAERTLSMHLPLQLAGYGVFVFLFCMVCHGELARLRPQADRLTMYYLAIAVGGALGGAAVSFLAPVIFQDLWEFQLTLLIGWAVIATAMLADRSSPLHRGDRRLFMVTVAGLLLLTARLTIMVTPLEEKLWEGMQVWMIAGAVATNIAAVIFVSSWRRNSFTHAPAWPRLFVIAVLTFTAALFAKRVHDRHEGATAAIRNFYGILRIRVYQDGDYRVTQLTHGNINHGLQIQDEAMRMTPTTYYVRSSGAGIAAQYLPRRVANPSAPVHLGVLGLGAGTMAAYAQTGDQVRFYDINPLVIALSRTEPPVFTYVRDCEGAVTIVPGDARLSLQEEFINGHPQEFDLLVIDVFSGDAIPVHLLTVEAFALYALHLRDEHSIIAVHISNRYLDLEPVVATNAKALGMYARVIDSSGDEPLKFGSSWVLLTRDPTFFEEPQVAEAEPYEPSERFVVFTDQFSNLLTILK